MPQNFTRQGAAMLFSVNDHYPVHKDVINSLWIAVRIIFKGIVMGKKIGSPVMDAFQVKDDDVGPRASSQHAAIH